MYYLPGVRNAQEIRPFKQVVRCSPSGGSLRTGLFGGSFDPVHNGHLHLAKSARLLAALDEVVFVPSRVPSHKAGNALAAPRHRLAMLKLAIDGIAGFSVSDVELASDEPGYTLETWRNFRRLRPGDELFFIIGGDSLCDLHMWNRAFELVDEVNFLILSRSGKAIQDLIAASPFSPQQKARLHEGILKAPELEISSSFIRTSLATGDDIAGLVPACVEDYIRLHSLYSKETKI